MHNYSSGSRRSACDRCRVHKLRCARPPSSDFAKEGSGGGLPSCERCVKARTECLYTVHMRRTSMRWRGYERTGSVSPLQRPLDDTLFSGVKAWSHMSQDSGSRSSFPGPMSPGPREGHATYFHNQLNSTDHAPRGQENFSWPRDSDFSGADLPALCGDFPALFSAGVNMGGNSTSSSNPYSHNPGSLASLPMQYAKEGYPNLQATSDRDSSGPTSSAKSNAPGVESDNNLKAMPEQISVKQHGTRVDSLQRLIELTSQLLECFGHTEDHVVELEDLLADWPCGKTRAAQAHGEPETGKNMVGMLLECSQVFLDIMERLKRLETAQQESQDGYSPASTDSSYANSTGMEVGSDEAKTGINQYSSMAHRRLDSRDSGVVADDIGLFDFSEALQSRQQEPAAAPVMQFHQPSGFPTVPTTFTIISCYMWLFRGYEVVFAAVHNALLAQKHEGQLGRQRSTNEEQEELVILPNVKIGGFDLSYYPHLQIEMLVHVSCQMMQRIEAVLVIDPASCKSRDLQSPLMETQNRVFDMLGAPAHLRAFLHGAESSSGDEGHDSARLSLDRGVVNDILQTLRFGTR
ncbi:hypothetical protein LY78DRAFT_709342 [Colletotrichum sublineola]|uniref:Zn(2)-C6 fungal-type domain-containing protein n=1 Tax=Colletotrichum sublineola TaxID=1173701 RepID=A0A066WVI5_COLSU|nr:hypothetical protein LY78DRAFT_709342 [Colletotrichum sublineola]KDN60908.1 hypothetical protein CSUB01_10984 [Colletotrichum sublineola]